MQARHRVRQVVNIVNLSTPLGLAVAALGARGVRRGPLGLLIAREYRLPFPIAAAFTVGNVVMVRGDDPGLDISRLLVHEARHSTQYAFCLGPVMLLLYSAAAGVSMAVCGDHSSYNPFERLAGLDDGGYSRRRPWWSRGARSR